jgi:hypothetical protein
MARPIVIPRPINEYTKDLPSPDTMLFTDIIKRIVERASIVHKVAFIN